MPHPRAPTRGRWTRKAPFPERVEVGRPRCPRMPGRSSPCATERKVPSQLQPRRPVHVSLQRDETSGSRGDFGGDS